MKKFFIYSAIFILLLGVFAPSGLNAQTNREKCMAIENNSTLCNGNDNPYGSPDAQVPAGKEAKGDPTPAATGMTGGIVMKVLSSVSMFILGLMSWLLWLAGTLLNYILDITIVRMSANISGMTGINVAWKAVRDVFNMAFIFLLLYNAILIIISKKTTDDIKKVVTGIILTALLINFSMFFTKVIIDASNVVTMGFYQSIYTAGQSSSVTVKNQTNSSWKINQGVTGAFVNSLKIASLFDSNNINSVSGGGNDDKALTIIGLGGSVLFLVLAFSFFAVSVMFVIRYIVLIFLLMLSPIGFIGFGLPQLRNIQNQWWDTLIGQCIFAPLYMFLTWVVLTLISSPGFLSATYGSSQTASNVGGGAGAVAGTATATFAQLFIGNGNGQPLTDSVGLFLNFVLVIGLIIITLTLSKSQASKGSSVISTATGKLTAFAGGVAMGGSAVALRKTVGWAGQKAADSKTMKDWASNSKFGQLGMRAARSAGSGSFDARRSFAGEQIATATGVNLGKGTIFNEKAGQGGYKKAKEEKEKKEIEYAKSLKSSDVEYEKAKEEDRVAKENAKEELGSNGFKEAEKNRKDAELNSDEYKRSERYLKAEKEKLENEASVNKVKTEKEKLEKLKKEIGDLEKAKVLNKGNAQREKEIDDQIKTKRAEVQSQNDVIAELNKVIEKNSVATKEREKYEKEWKSKDMKDLEEIAKTSDKNEKALDAIWNERKNAYASGVENARMKRYVMMGLGAVGGGLVGGLGGAVAGVATARTFTKAEQEHIARKIRNETGKKKELSKKEKAELRKKLKGLDEDSNEAKEIKKKLGWEEEDKELES